MFRKLTAEVFITKDKAYKAFLIRLFDWIKVWFISAVTLQAKCGYFIQQCSFFIFLDYFP